MTSAEYWLEHPYTEQQTARERIRQRRAQLLIHSCLYYVFDEPIVSDSQWDAWALDLVKLHDLFGTTIGFYDEAFADWDGSTGFHLPLRDPYVTGTAGYLRRVSGDAAPLETEMVKVVPVSAPTGQRVK